MLSDVDVIEVKFVVRLCAKDSELLHLFECMDKANLKYKIDFQMVITEKKDTTLIIKRPEATIYLYHFDTLHNPPDPAGPGPAQLGTTMYVLVLVSWG